MFEVCHLKPEHTVLVSGAAGAVGLAFVQIAKKVVGCKRVVGVAGGKAKCDYVKSLGADECVDYKADDFAEKLRTALPEHADVFFDNVGGKVLDTGFTLMKRYGFIGQCGAISGECAASAASELHATIARTTLISRLPRRAARA